MNSLLRQLSRNWTFFEEPEWRNKRICPELHPILICEWPIISIFALAVCLGENQINFFFFSPSSSIVCQLWSVLCSTTALSLPLYPPKTMSSRSRGKRRFHLASTCQTSKRRRKVELSNLEWQWCLFDVFDCFVCVENILLFPYFIRNQWKWFSSLLLWWNGEREMDGQVDQVAWNFFRFVSGPHSHRALEHGRQSVPGSSEDSEWQPPQATLGHHYSQVFWDPSLS